MMFHCKIRKFCDIVVFCTLGIEKNWGLLSNHNKERMQNRLIRLLQQSLLHTDIIDEIMPIAEALVFQVDHL